MPQIFPRKSGKLGADEFLTGMTLLLMCGEGSISCLEELGATSHSQHTPTEQFPVAAESCG